jgi:hypothetical protein
MNEVLDKSSSYKSTTNIMNNSKIKFLESNKFQNTKNTNGSLTTKSITNKQQKSFNNSNNHLNNNTSTISIPRPVKKPIIEYNGVGDNPIESEKSTLYSTWTPLSDDHTNNKVIINRLT